MASWGKPIVIEPSADHSASVIFLHGLGDEGQGWQDPLQGVARTLPYARFVMPTAPVRPVTRFGGMASTAWFDLVGCNDRADEPFEGLDEAVEGVHALIDAEVARGVPRSRIILGGFSMGAGLTFYTGATDTRTPPLAGLVIVSGYLPRTKTVEFANTASPVLQLHGDADTMVLLEWAKAARERAEAAGVSVEMVEYEGLGHSVTEPELQLIRRWLAERLPP
eukprot:CAMPEP_0182890830 /NCGR_PEP_ID=MMETSP0034_2-20130328/22896_1 /TAXON_ID=156128 /ORGANISM="Nephroselmis pyriformis, Strain CCMP717" /LENGTH=221 /DNA_ID=CAMNT_0025024409 /DNA_START=117 /DNA_END=782 /DNA_ORIENTATION=+